jgi:enoyl-[acyl-carrier-protein] reductase (NADH)
MLQLQQEGKRLALVMGVANHRSVAWAVVQSLLQRNFDCIVTCTDRYRPAVEKLMVVLAQQQQSSGRGRILGAVACNVETDVPSLFSQTLPDFLHKNNISQHHDTTKTQLDAIVHCIAYSNMSSSAMLSRATWSVYAQAQQVSAYSFLEVAQAAVQHNLLHTTTQALPPTTTSVELAMDKNPSSSDSAPQMSPLRGDDTAAPPSSSSSSSSLIALTYLGAVRAVPNYQCMGPAKAALESIVRGLASEYGEHGIHVNAVSAGPMATISARGIAQFSVLQNHVQQTAPLRRSVTQHEVAEAVAFLSTATGITGQTVYVDAGYSSVVPVHV